MLRLLVLPTTLVHSCSELLMATWHEIHKGIRVALSRLANSSLHVVYVHVWSTNSNTLEGAELRIGTLELCVVIGYKLLNHVEIGILQVFVCVGRHFLDFLEVVDSDILIAVVLEDFACDFLAFETISVDEVAILATCAPIGPVVVAAWHSAEVAWFDDQVLIHDCLLAGDMRQLGQLNLPLFVDLLVFVNRLVSQAD